ncbi:recombinase family protein [Cognaticolwellia aestuarii]|uniref:recombinase family protein n=1 Tax=Cognaticolwellia aestuarii TaxID=329993 RepID=UPI000987986B|nr:recombinase family protein [Cognaticolwellia aestuarii]
MAKAISYIRFSSSKQETGDSLKRQQAMINDWFSNNPNTEPSDMSFKDLGLSGYHGTNLKHDFGRLLDAIEANKIKAGDYILVEAIDRIGRLDTLTALSIITNICMNGVKIITLEDNQEYSKEVVSKNAGIIYYLIGKIDMAHQHSKNLSRRISSRWRSKKEDAAKGKMIKRKSFWWITRNDKSDMFDTVTPEDKELIHLVVKMFLSGSSYSDLVKHVQSVDQQRFLKCSHTAVKQWLLSRTLMGFWEDAEIYPPVISKAEYYLVQDEIKKRKDNKVQGKSSGHIMAGLVKCGVCGGNYSVRQHKHSGAVMYCTKSKRAGKLCSNTKSMPMPIIEEFRRLNQLGYIYNIINDDLQLEIEDSIIKIDANIKDLTERSNRIRTSIELNHDQLLSIRLKDIKEEINQLEVDKRNTTINIKTKFKKVKQASQVFNENMSNLMSEPNKLNGLLKSVDFAIIGNGATISIDNSSLEYLSFNQVKMEYTCLNESYEEIVISK